MHNLTMQHTLPFPSQQD